MTSPEQLVAAHVRDVPDWPLPGIVFKDITPLLADAEAFAAVLEAFAAPLRGKVDKVVGIEARGFILAAPVAVACGAGFVPLRKRGKLPPPTFEETYALEYGTATLEISAAALQPGDRVAVVDDVLATGGTAEAACALVERLGGEIVELAMLIELGFLNGRARVADRPLRSLVTL